MTYPALDCIFSISALVAMFSLLQGHWRGQEDERDCQYESGCHPVVFARDIRPRDST